MCPESLKGACLRPLVVPGQPGGWRSAGLGAHLSNYFPFLRAAHQHPAHPPGCLAWIEAWAFFFLTNLPYMLLSGGQPKSDCCKCWNSSRPWTGASPSGQPGGDGAGMGSVQGWCWRPCTPRLGAALASPVCFLLLSLPTWLGSALPVLQQGCCSSLLLAHRCVPPLLLSHPPPVPLTVCLLSPRSLRIPAPKARALRW